MKEETQKLLNLAKERNALQAAWYRQILTIAAGGLALLVGLAPETPPSGPARYFLAAAWVLLGAGILTGAGATYSGASLAKRLTIEFQSQLLRSLEAGENLPPSIPIVARPHLIFRTCKILMVVSLLGAVVCVVTFAVLRTLGV